MRRNLDFNVIFFDMVQFKRENKYLQGESSKVFPFNKHQARPSSLPLPISQRNNKKEEPAKVAASSELQNFANTLVDGVIKTVSESKEDCLGKDTTEITVTDTDKGQVTEEKSS